MHDGLYQVTTPYLCAGFVVKDGRVTLCAPILRKRLTYWQTVAVPVRGPRPGGAGGGSRLHQTTDQRLSAGLPRDFDIGSVRCGDTSALTNP